MRVLKGALPHLLVVGLSAVLTWWWVLPLIGSFGTAVPGPGPGDNLTFVWNLWWTRYALAGFLGVKTTEAGRDQARLVGFNQSLDINCVLLVDRLSGLRSESELTRDGDESGERPSFVGARYRDASARVWQELSLVELAGNDLFLKIVG